MRPLISVVIPTYNRARELERALRSVRAQTCAGWEAVVVDNHSSDNIDDVILGFNDARIKLFKIHNNGVIAASRNLGVKHARGEYIAFLDSDDWWSPRKLEVSLKYLGQGTDVVYHKMFVVTKPGQKFFWRKGLGRELSSPVFEDLLVNGNGLSTSSVVVRKSILQEIGGLSEDAAWIAWEDYDAWLRVARITERFRRIPKTLGYYWCGGGNTSSLDRSVRMCDYFNERFKERYSNTLAASVTTTPWWIHYSKGSAHYQMGSNAMAETNLKRLLWQQTPVQFALKSLWMRLMIRFVHGINQ